MESTYPTSRRNMSQDMDGKQFSTFVSKSREITNAINKRDPSSLLKMSFRRTSVTQDRPTDENFDSSVQLLVLKKTINLQKLFVGKGDSKVSILKQELKQLEIEETKRDFWHRQNTLKLKQLENSLEEALKSQMEEIHNQEINNHLLKRMKKTKIFLELKSFALNNCLENSESILKNEKKKNLLSQELAIQTVNTSKEFKKAIMTEKGEGHSQIFDLQKSIQKSKIVSERRDAWKKHQETMYEAAVIEDRTLKSLNIKEALSLHKLWHNVLTATFEVKKAKFSRLEESFQRIKIITGIPEIALVVENFLTKEQTYEALMSTVNKKESECSNYKKKIHEMQTMVNNFSNKEISETFSLDQMRSAQHEKMKENEELSQKSFIIKNIHGKVKTWIKMMIRKFNLILNKPNLETSEDHGLMFYINQIKSICSAQIQESSKKNEFGLRVEDGRKLVIKSFIQDLSKVSHTVQETDHLVESDLIGIDNEDDKFMSRLN